MNIRNVTTDTKLLLHTFTTTANVHWATMLDEWQSSIQHKYLLPNNNQLVKGHDSNNNSSKIKTGFLNPFMHFTNEIQQNTSIRLDI